MKKYFLLVLFLIPAFAQAQDSDLGNWLIYFGNKKINEKLNWHHEVQYRNYNAIGDLEQLLLRTGVGINLTENNNNLLLGYGHILSENYIGEGDEKVGTRENRIYQQFITKQSIGRVKVQHRYRFEQRFIEDNFALRFRYFLAVNVPLNNKDMIDKTAYLTTYNEIFLGTKGPLFDRNRLYGGLGYRLNKLVRFEAGYMNQMLANRNRGQVKLITFLNF